MEATLGGGDGPGFAVKALAAADPARREDSKSGRRIRDASYQESRRLRSDRLAAYDSRACGGFERRGL
ncbi:hypothetical protein AGR7A_pAt30144 [Agrobacterium deltaense NCPPB 1641]|uniref:Uncharacterized protein n=1 Tax=Agrobacterium deltaense NCPPB 1641 TaxID=1183425 RepID=A0A1S7UB37_9HYPH|nr:hypothetical protein AGR7A_pAt30144 [Agrobacterium deltaense NCPPB 1641]